MAPKKNPADPTRSGTSSGKGKGRARQPSPTPEPSDDPEEPKFYAPPDLSDDDFPHYQPLLQNRRANGPGESAWSKRLRTTMLRSKPDAAPNKRWPARRRLIASSPVNPLRSKFRAHQPRELTCRRQAALHRSGAKTPSNTYKYLRTGAPHPVPPHGPQNAVEARRPHHARTQPML